jgi:UDP-2-acetamido-3-amino-2,3-dideoxy-glucuronate N-acetyltransferase|tara:strand:- start:2492 stop:3496 length:1005 start_codon:yes stop_codon:yes gene_type:complete
MNKLNELIKLDKMKSDNKVCVVGAGNWGKNHIRTLNELGVLGGIVDANNERLNQYSDQYPDVSVFTNLTDALSDNSFLGFTVATPAETHFNIGKIIIEAKKHLLIEKPFTLNIDDAEQLVKQAEANNINLMVGHVLLFHPAIIKIKELIDENKIGKLQYVYSNRLNLGQIRTEENVFWSLAPHDISIFQYFIEDFPIQIKASGSTFLQKGIHDSTLTILEYSNNINGHIFVSWLHPFKEHRLVVVGSEGMLSFEDSAIEKPLKYYNKKFELNGKIPEKMDGEVEFIDYNHKMPLTEELRYFVDHLDGTKPIKANGEHALEVMKILVKVSEQLEK